MKPTTFFPEIKKRSIHFEVVRVLPQTLPLALATVLATAPWLTPKRLIASTPIPRLDEALVPFSLQIITRCVRVGPSQAGGLSLTRWFFKITQHASPPQHCTSCAPSWCVACVIVSV